MNGVHDLGGMDGFGPVVREQGEPIFHEPWERRVFGMLLATMAQGVYNIDELRHSIERMTPAHYLGSTYYEHWLAGLERILGEKGKLSAADVDRRLRQVAAGGPAAPSPSAGSPLAEALLEGVKVGAPTSRGKGKARFRRGARVRVRKMNPHGHTRCPRYVRGAVGTIERVNERFVFPDAHAHGGGESPQVLYTVGFEAKELWGADAQGRGRVYVDLWESYLEPTSRSAVRSPKAVRARPRKARASHVKRKRR
jgi:nitrile hydratase subunit beta